MNNNFLRYVKINKFIIHNRKNKEKYLCVNINDLEYATKNYTVKIELLGKYFRIEGGRIYFLYIFKTLHKMKLLCKKRQEHNTKQP